VPDPLTISSSISDPIATAHLSTISSSSSNYANAVKGLPQVTISKVISLLTDLLITITSAKDPKSIMTATINSFIKLLSTNHA